MNSLLDYAKALQKGTETYEEFRTNSVELLKKEQKIWNRLPGLINLEPVMCGKFIHLEKERELQEKGIVNTLAPMPHLKEEEKDKEKQEG